MVTGRCPICGKDAADKVRPFCSARCKQIDLSRWLSGRYVIPGTPDDEDEVERPPRREEDDTED
jgi:endogenous inhibitor of DNA gyrase (YacG/DUF329 family)